MCMEYNLNKIIIAALYCSTQNVLVLRKFPSKQNIFHMQTFNNSFHSRIPDKIVIRARALMAPTNTVNLGCFIAIIAAMKNVLSPNSDTTMTDKAAIKACKNPNLSCGFSDTNSGNL